MLLFFCFTGAFQYRSDLQSVRLYQSTGGFHIFMMASEAIYFLFILYYMFQQVSPLLRKLCSLIMVDLIENQKMCTEKDILFIVFVLTGQAYEAAQVGIFQEQVECFGASHHYFKLECIVCFHQEDSVGQPGH